MLRSRASIAAMSGVGLAARFAFGADVERVADGDRHVDRPVHRDVADQVFLEPLDRLDQPAGRGAIDDVIGRIVIQLLREVGVFEQRPATRLFRVGQVALD